MEAENQAQTVSLQEQCVLLTAAISPASTLVNATKLTAAAGNKLLLQLQKSRMGAVVFLRGGE